MRIAVFFTYLIGCLSLSAAAEQIVVDFTKAELKLSTDEGERIAIYPVVLPKRSYFPKAFPVSGKLVRMTEKPSWSPTPRVKAEYRRKTGRTLPDLVKPGPGNPMGAFKFTISFDPDEFGRPLVDATVRIHGTNQPAKFKLSADRRYLSRGCVRMLNKDIIELAGLIKYKPVTVRFAKGAEKAKDEKVVPPMPTGQVMAKAPATQAQ